MRVNKPIISIAVCMFLLCSMAAGASAKGGGAGVAFDPGTGTVNFTYGTVSMAYGAGSQLTGLRHLSLTGLWNDTSADHLDSKKKRTVIGQTWGSGPDNAELKTTVEEGGSGLVVSQKASAQTKGITGVQWGLVVPDRYDLIIPVLGGIRLTAASPDAAYGFQQFDYPNVWEAQMFLIQGADGGMLVHADDNAGYFKSLHVKHENGNFYVGLETYSPAPFEQVGKANSAGWKLRAYEGDWVNGANMYRKWADSTFDLSRLSKLKPEWTKNVQFTVLTDLEDMPMLQTLAQKVKADQTLLVVPGWRRDAYDTNYPDYTPKPDIAAKIKAAQALGFKVMLYVNIFGVSPDNPDYAAMQPYQVEEPFTHNPVFSEYTAGTAHIKFAQVNPASKAWRKLFVDKMKELVHTLHPDGLHLDQSLLMYNDANGPINGMNMMQGNIALHRDLTKALPSNIALGGESLNEITTRYEAFAQRHAYGIFAQTGTWDNIKIDQVTPASTAIFAPYTTTYGHPDFANPMTEDYFMAWHKVVQDRLGAIPILTRPNYEQVANATPLMEEFLAEAKWYQDNKPKADFSTWTDTTLYAFRTADGHSAKYERDAYGEKLTEYGSDGHNQEVTRYLYGSGSVALPGQIPGWRLYDDTKLFGLNPDKTYLYLDKPRDPDAFHVFELPSDVSLNRVSVQAGYANLTLHDKLQADVVDFMDYPGPIRAGEQLSDGAIHETAGPFSSENGFSFTFPQGGTVQHWGDRILAHPPYMGQWQGGHTYLEFDVRLPEDRTPRFTAGVQLGSEENVQKSDGVTFDVYAWEKGAPADTRQVLSREQFSRSATPTPVEMDLSSLKGKEVTIRMETHAGTTVDNDSAVWVKPGVILAPGDGNERLVSLKLVSPLPVSSVASASGRAQIASLGGSRYSVTAPAADDIYLIFGQSDPVQLPLALSDKPFDSDLLFDNGTESPPVRPFGGFPGEGTVQDVLKQGLDAHPPLRGQTRINYLTNLPDTDTTNLNGFAGIKDGADESQGIGFRIQVNGKELWKADLQPGGTWTPFHLSLADYAGRSVVITFITDSMGDNGYDWAFWGEPTLSAGEL